MEKKQVGRPKLYDTSSDKVDAFRKRLESAGYMRKELLVTQETWDQVTALAKENGVSASDAASGLLEHGVRAFSAKRSMPVVSFSRKQQETELVAEAPPFKRKTSVNTNPIAEFFAKRKESSKQAAADETDPAKS
jgi:hypothetical protein